MNGYLAIKEGHGRYGMNLIIGGHCTMTWKGRKLLGQIVSQGIVALPGGTQGVRLTVKHMNGSPWPVEPLAALVDVLERTYETEPSTLDDV